MSQELRQNGSGSRDISRTFTDGVEQSSFEGFEGMNYEQVRQPYNSNYKDRNSNNDERQSSKRPDES